MLAGRRFTLRRLQFACKLQLSYPYCKDAPAKFESFLIFECYKFDIYYFEITQKSTIHQHMLSYQLNNVFNELLFEFFFYLTSVLVIKTFKGKIYYILYQDKISPAFKFNEYVRVRSIFRYLFSILLKFWFYPNG